MVNDVIEAVLTKTKEKKVRKSRDTVLTRIDRGIKEEVKGLSKRLGETMASLNDRALRENLNSMKLED